MAACALAAGLSAVAPARALEAASETVEARPASPGFGQQAVLHALSLLGVRYKLGGNAPETGLDCSGLVRHVFREVAGVGLPRRSVEMSRIGEAVEDPSELRPGDLVFFRNLGRLVSHVGIYIGDHAFVHAASQRHAVRVDRIDEAHWRTRFVGARRVAPGEALPDVGPRPAVLREVAAGAPARAVPVAARSVRARAVKSRQAPAVNAAARAKARTKPRR